MNLSKYSFLFNIEKQYYAYNTLSNALIEIDSNTYKTLKSKQKMVVEDYGFELFDVLKQNTIITENDEDDFLVYKSIILKQRTQNTGMHVTLAPTMDCCFNCHYCFERCKQNVYMSHDVMDSIIKYILSKKGINFLNITWFGGEPLMAIKEIETFYDKFKPLWGERKLDANIITTGYHIDLNSIRVLKKIGITSMQITLDGLKETHNKIKNFPNSGDSFEKVLSNIELLNDNAPDIQIVIRVNLTLNNAHEYVELQNLVHTRYNKRKNISISPAFVLDRDISGCATQKTNLFNHKQRSEFILDLANKGLDLVYTRYPQRFFNECAIRNDMAIVFDPEGYAYKCWEIIGDKKYAIGKLNNNGDLTGLNLKVLNRQLLGADAIDDPICKGCKYLPICHGGCPIQRIQNKFEGSKNCTCIYYKGYMEQFLKLHLKLKKAGFENK